MSTSQSQSVRDAYAELGGAATNPEVRAWLEAKGVSVSRHLLYEIKQEVLSGKDLKALRKEKYQKYRTGDLARNKVYREKNKKKLTAYEKKRAPAKIAAATEKRRLNLNGEREKAALATRTARAALRAKVIEHLGGKCRRCGFNDHRAFQIDHVLGGGGQERKLFPGNGVLRKVLADTTGKYQLLCANCNQIKKYENNEHPGRKPCQSSRMEEREQELKP